MWRFYQHSALDTLILVTEMSPRPEIIACHLQNLSILA
jgi:hypothetical protein